MTVFNHSQAVDALYGSAAKTAQARTQQHHGSAHALAGRSASYSVPPRVAPTEPSSLLKYRLIKKIGQGSFSTVHHAIHLPTNREVALKVIDKNTSNLDTIVTEITAMTRLRGHPHIVQLYDVFEDEQFVYMSLEYCPNGNLHEYLVANGRLSEEHARVWFKQLLSAVMFCQQQGVISRDLKNSNCVLDAYGNIKLIDLGLSVLVDNAYTDTIAHSAGSAVFAAPEVYAARRRPYLPVPSDVWALGAILHSMVKRVLPFPHLDYSRHWANYTAPDHVSEELQQLLTSIFNLNPLLRPTPIEIMHHPWVMGKRLPEATGAVACMPTAAAGA